MANFSPKIFAIHDDYMTPKYAWENIQQYIPKNKVLWESFYGDGKSGEYLRELGFEVIHEPINFFTESRGDIIVSNPPFSKSKEVFARLKELDKPFIVLMPSQKINTSYIRNFFMNTADPLQVIIPRKRIHFTKLLNGKPIENYKSACAFDCFYYCYKINLPRDIIWLE